MSHELIQIQYNEDIEDISKESSMNQERKLKLFVEDLLEKAGNSSVIINDNKSIDAIVNILKKNIE